MAYQSKARRPTKDLREPVPGNGKVLPPSKPHSVIITVADIESNKLKVTFRDSFDNTHVERIFFLNQEGNDLSGLMKQLLAITIPDSTGLRIIYDAIMENDSLGLAIVGHRCIIETEYRGSYINIKSIRAAHVINRNDGGGFFQSTPSNTTHASNSTDTERFKGASPISTIAASFM